MADTHAVAGCYDAHATGTDRQINGMDGLDNLCTEKTLAPSSSAPATRSGSPEKYCRDLLAGQAEWKAKPPGSPVRSPVPRCRSVRRSNWLPAPAQVPPTSGGSDAAASDVRTRYLISSIVPEAARRSSSKRHHIFVGFSFSLRASYLDLALETRIRRPVPVRIAFPCIPSAYSRDAASPTARMFGFVSPTPPCLQAAPL